MGVSGGGGSLRDVLLGGAGGGSGMGRGTTAGGSSSRGTSHGLAGGAGGGALTWRSLRSVSGAVDPRGHFFPAKLAMSLGILKLLLAIFMVTLGALALILQAALSPLGAGMWAGAVVGVSGFLGVCASRRPYAHVYVVSFMCVAILSMASSGLLIILSATAWARDDQHPTAVFVEQETQEEVTVLGEVFVRRPAVLVSGALVLLGVLDCLVSLACAAISAREACGLYSKGEDTTQGLSEGHNRKERLYRWLGQQKTIFPIGSSQSPPRGVSSVSQFVPLSSDSSSSSATPRKSSSGPSGTSSSLPSASSHRVLPSSGSSSGKTNSTRVTPPSVPSILKPSSLASLHGSRSLPPTSSSAVVGVPYKHKHAPAAPTSEHTPSAFSHPQHGAKLNMAPHLHQPHHQMHPHLHSLPLPHPHAHPHPHPHPNAHPHPHPHPRAHPQHPPVHPHQLPQHFPAHAAHPSLYYPHLVTPMMPYYPTDQDLQQTHKNRKKESSKKRKDGKNKQKEEEKKKKKERKRKSKELTDEQIERTYTGLDRELAEEFIDSTMEPGLSLQRAFNTSFDQDSF